MDGFDSVKIIKAARFLCVNNYNKRRETKTHIQYTITILPGFLIPYGRIPIDKLLDAVSGYINGKYGTYYAAALVCWCSSRHSFSLYYLRILYKITPWCRLLKINITQTTSESSQPGNDEIEGKWDLIVRELKSRAEETETPQWQAQGHTNFFFHNMGLGP
jgi:hypothetical protein